MGEKSIYEELKNFYDKSCGENYKFQNYETAGFDEFNALTSPESSLGEGEKNMIALKMLGIYKKTAEGSADISVLEDYLDENPICEYYEKAYLVFKKACENDSEKKNIGKLTLDILYHNKFSETVKAALLISPLFNFEKQNEIFKIYATHNKYNFYVFEGLEKLNISNEEFFKYAKKTRGYGRYFVCRHLEPLNHEIKKWLINNSANNDTAVEELIVLNVLSQDLHEYMKSEKFTSAEFEDFSNTLSNALVNEEYISPVKYDLLFTILDLARKYGKGIKALNLIVTIISLIENKAKSYAKQEILYEDDLDREEESIIFIGEEIIKESRWKKAVKNAIEDGISDVGIIIICASKIGYNLKSDELEKLFARDPYNIVLFNSCVTSEDKKTRKLACSYLISSLRFNNITDSSRDCHLGELTIDDSEHICFYFLIKYLKRNEFKEQYTELNIMALNSPIIETRMIAVSNLCRIKEELSDAEIERIKIAADTESIENIELKLNELINHEKVQNSGRQINVKKYSGFMPNVKDIEIGETEIKCITNYDEMFLKGRIKKQTILYAALDEKKNDKNVYITDTRGLILGRIKGMPENIIRNLILGGKLIYAIVKSIDDIEEKVSVDLMMSCFDVMEDINNTVMLLAAADTQLQ